MRSGTLIAVVLTLTACSARLARIDRAATLTSVKGAKSHVVVIPPDGASEADLVGYLTAWQEAGTFHVLPLDPDHPERATGLLPLADIIELAGPGPHTLLDHEAVGAALAAARARGVVVLGGR